MGCGEKQICSIKMRSNGFNGAKIVHFLCHLFIRYFLDKYLKLLIDIKRVWVS